MNALSSLQTKKNKREPSRFGSGWIIPLLSAKRRIKSGDALGAATTTKNYAGRHDQQMHTTLFNLANPSQGRRGDDKRAKPVLEKTAGTSPVGRIPVSSPERLVQLRQERRAELGEWRLDNGLSMDRELSSSFDTSSAHAEFANNAFHNAVSAGQIKKEAAHLDPRAVADGKNFEATFKKVVSLETGKFLKEQKFALTDAEKKMTNDFGNINAFRRYLQEKYEDGGGAKLSAFDSRLTAIEKMLSTQMLRVQTWDRVDNRIESRADVDFARNYTDWKGRGNSPNPLRALSYDGVLNHKNMPAAVSIGIARTALVGDPRKSAARQAFERERVEVKAGTDTTNEIIRMATQMGVKTGIIAFEPQPLGSPTRLADYDRRTGLVTFYPHLTNAAGNTRAYIRAVINHEVNHLRSEEVKVALNNGVKFAKNQEMLRLLTNPEQIYKGLRDNQPLSLSKGKSEVEQTFIGMIRADGITDYSAKFWKDFAMFPSPQTLKRAVDETLAEVSYEATGRGKSERGYINQNWLAASNAMNGAFDSMQVGES